MNDDEKVIYFGETDARNKRLKFGIKRADRSRHMYAIGKTGMGKSTLLENLAVQDIQNGDGICFIDPHGKSADLLLEYVPKERIKDVVYFAPFDMEFPISFNVMEDVGPERRYLVSSGLMAAFKKIWVDAWSARMEYILGNIMLALLEYPGSTLVGVNRMLTDKDFRKEVVSKISDPSVKAFWVNEYANYTDKFAAEAAPAIQNKVGQFVANPLIRNIIGQPKSTFDIRQIMDEKKILIVNLSKGRVGEANANLLGSMLITKIYLAAMSRADLKEKELKAAPNFYMYVDEFQSFANESFADILSEARKYKLNLIIAHQYIEQMTEEVRAAVFGNVGTMCIFRVGATDAEYLEKEFAPAFTAEDLVSLGKYQMYLKLMIDGVTSPPFSASGMPPIQRPEINYTKEIIDSSRAQYSRPRNEIEDEIKSWHEIQFGKGGGSSAQGGSQGSTRPAVGAQQGTNRGPSERPVGGSFGGDRPERGERPPAVSNTAQGSNFAQQRPQNMPRGDQKVGFGAQAQQSEPAATSGSVHHASGQSGQRSPENRQNQSRPAGSSQTQAGGSQGQGGYKFQPNQFRPSGSAGQAPQMPPTSPMAQRHQGPQGMQINQGGQRIDQQGRSPFSRGQNQQADNASTEKRDKADARESELRKAISLSYLKAPEEPEVKNDDKAPKPENLSALRDALLSVMQATSSAAAVQKFEENIDQKRDERPAQADARRDEQRAAQPEKQNMAKDVERGNEQAQPDHQKTHGSHHHKHHPSFNPYPKPEPFHTVSDRVERNAQSAHHAEREQRHESDHKKTAEPASKEVPSDLLENLFNE